MESYIDEAGPVNAEVDAAEIEIPTFLPPRPAQAASSKPRHCISPKKWGSLRAAIAKQHQALPPDSPRVRPTLPKLQLREPA